MENFGLHVFRAISGILFGFLPTVEYFGLLVVDSPDMLNAAFDRGEETPIISSDKKCSTCHVSLYLVQEGGAIALG